MVALELEVMAKKYDRFGWDRDRGTAVHDRLVMDWVRALQPFPLDEVREGCRLAIAESPHRMPHEGIVAQKVMDLRSRKAQDFMRKNRARTAVDEPDRGSPEDLARRRALSEELLGSTFKKVEPTNDD